MRRLTLSAVLGLICTSTAWAQSTETIDAKPVGGESNASATTNHDAAGIPGLATNRGWDGSWALLFSVNNFIGANTTSWFSNLPGGTIGGEYFAQHNTALRVLASLSRNGDNPTITKNTVQAGGQDVNTYQFAEPGNSSVGSVILNADGLMRFMDTAVAPYAGAGLLLSWSRSHLGTKDDVSVQNEVTTHDRASTAFTFGLRGFLGAEWRLHPNFSIFAEYQVVANVFQQQTSHDTKSVAVTTGGQTSVDKSSSESKKHVWLPFVGTNGMTFGGNIGLAVHFQ